MQPIAIVSLAAITASGGAPSSLNDGRESFPAAAIAVVAPRHGYVGDAETLELLDRPQRPFGADRRILGTRDDAESPVARVDQFADQPAFARRMVAAHRVHGGHVGCPVVEHDRDLCLVEHPELFTGQHGGRDHAIDPVLHDLVKRRRGIPFGLQGEQQHPDAPSGKPLRDLDEHFRGSSG